MEDCPPNKPAEKVQGKIVYTSFRINVINILRQPETSMDCRRKEYNVEAVLLND